MIASEVMDRSRVHLNDAGGDLFTNDVLLPFLSSAWEELQSTMQAHGLPIMTETSSVILLPAGGISLGTTAVVPYPTLPLNFIEPKEVYERTPGTPHWEPMTEAHGIVNRTPQMSLGVWEWDGDELKFIGALTDREILLRYLKGLPEITSANTLLPITGAKRYLALKTAAEASDDIGQNRARSDRLETKAEFEMNRFLAIRVKGQQDKSVRRRGYASRSPRWSSPLPY